MIALVCLIIAALLAFAALPTMVACAAGFIFDAIARMRR